MKVFALLVVALIASSFFFFRQQPQLTETLRSTESLYLENTIANHINSIQSHWVAGRNIRWDHANMDFIKRQMGTFKNTNSKHGLPEVSTVTDPIPDYFDPRTQWSYCDSLKEVRDQANCGSCWAFGATESFTDRWCIYSQGKYQDRISSEDLLDCCDTCGFGCNGGEPTFAWAYFTHVGVSSGGLYNDTKWCKPYHLAPCDHHISGKYTNCTDTPSLPTPSCQFQCNNQYTGSYATDFHKVKYAYTISKNIKAIQTELMTYGPAEASIVVYEDFLTYKSGVYYHITGSELGGHSIKIMGWGVENDMEYWLCANSWNEDWGDQGFFKIKKGSDECGIEDEVIAGIPDLPTSN